MNAIISGLWHRSAGDVLERQLANDPAVVYARPGFSGTQEPQASRLAKLGINVIPLPSLLTPGVIAGLQAQAATRSRRIAEDLTERAILAAYGHLGLDPMKIRAALMAQLASRLYDILATVESIVIAAGRHRIELVIVNNDAEAWNRSAIAWARSAGVKTLHLAHTLGSPHRAPELLSFHADVLATPARKSAYVYEGLGIAADRFILTGWPWHDKLPGLLVQRDAIRSGFRRKYGIGPADPVVMFATTWFGGYGALENKNVYEDSARIVFRAMRAVRERLPEARLVVKDRDNNVALRGRLDELATAEGLVPGSWLRIDDDPLPVLISVDLVVCAHSSIATEAAAIGVPVIDIWSLHSWFLGPLFSGDDGVIEAPPDRLADVVASHLIDPAAARVAISEGRLRSEGILLDGDCTDRLAALIGALRRQSSHVVEPGAADRVSRADGGDQRCEVIDGIIDAGSVVDLRCGDGRRGERLRTRFPGATIIGMDPDPTNVQAARSRIDVAQLGTAAAHDIDRLGLVDGSIDAVLLFDALSRVDDPHETLRCVRKLLRDGARVYASFANARTPGTIARLVDGSDLTGPGGAFAYDVRRQFTLASAVGLFNASGFNVERAAGIPDPFSSLPQPPYAESLTIEIGRLTVKNLARAEMLELRVTEFILTAIPRR